MLHALMIFQRAARLAAPLALLSLLLWIASCSSDKIEGVPERLPEIPLSGSTATPPHHMASYEYPFDSNGNYVSDWAAEGERRAGRSRGATDDDQKKWSSSHRGTSSGASRPVKSSNRANHPPANPRQKAPRAAPSIWSRKGDTVGRIAQRYGVSVCQAQGRQRPEVRPHPHRPDPDDPEVIIPEKRPRRRIPAVLSWSRSMNALSSLLRRLALAALAATAGGLGAFETVVIDPGHGGNDEGTKWRGLSEKDLTLSVARRLEKILRDKTHRHRAHATLRLLHFAR